MSNIVRMLHACVAVFSTNATRLWGFFGNLVFAIIARMLSRNHLNRPNYYSNMLLHSCCCNFWFSRGEETSSTCLVTEAKNEILSTWLLLMSQIQSADTAIPEKSKRRRMVSSYIQNNVSPCSIKFHISQGSTWHMSWWYWWMCSWLLRHMFL